MSDMTQTQIQKVSFLPGRIHFLKIYTQEFPALALLSGLRIQRCPELWCKLQTPLRSHVAVAVSGQQVQLQFDP